MSLRSASLLHVAAASLAAVAACSQPASVLIEPLRVLNWAPSPGAICVDVDVAVHATFSTDIDPASLTVDTFVLRNAAGPVAGALDYDPNTFTATFAPTSQLEYAALHTVVVENVASAEQGTLPIKLEASFQTIKRTGCTPDVECALDSDCAGTEICANIGICTPQCVTDNDCYEGTCAVDGTCTGG
jgi:hypothetical protein